jgi:hypothetical protein
MDWLVLSISYFFIKHEIYCNCGLCNSAHSLWAGTWIRYSICMVDALNLYVATCGMGSLDNKQYGLYICS